MPDKKKEQEAIQEIMEILKKHNLNGASVERVMRVAKYKFSTEARLRD